MGLDAVHVRLMHPGEADAVATLWHETRKATYHFLPTEAGVTLAMSVRDFSAHIAAKMAIWVAEEDGVLRGFLAISGAMIDRLYIHPTAQRRGVGTALLQQARRLSPDHLWLYTHVENHGARAFYERHGFVATKFGISPPPESAPDVEYHWRP